MSIASRTRDDVDTEPILRYSWLSIDPKFCSHKLNGETFDVTLYRTVVMGEERCVLEVDIWSEEQMSSEQIQQIRHSRQSIRQTGS